MYTHIYYLYTHTYIYVHIFIYVGTCIYKFTHMYTNMYQYVCVCVCAFLLSHTYPHAVARVFSTPTFNPRSLPSNLSPAYSYIHITTHSDSPLFFVCVLIFIYIYIFPPLCHAGALTRVTAHTGAHIWRDLKSPTSRRSRVSHYALLPYHERHTIRRAAICGSGLDT